jgi:hypothetical protein
MLRAILYGMFHPLTGAYHIAYFYHFTMQEAVNAMYIALATDLMLIFLAVAILVRVLQKTASK